MLRLMVLGATLLCGTLFAGDTIQIIASGPWDDSYNAREANRTRTWIRCRSGALQNLNAGEKLKVWIQWAPTSEGPWKVHSKGEIELRTNLATKKEQEHPRFKTRGYLTKDLDSIDGITLEMTPIASSNWDHDLPPFFRVSQAIRQPGKKWVKASHRMTTPEDNGATFTPPFQTEMEIVYAYLHARNAHDKTPIPFTQTDIQANQAGPWSSPSFTHGPLPYVGFFVVLGGVNVGAVIPSHPFVVQRDSDNLDFWSCRNKPKGYRGIPADTTSLDSLWWGVCPIHVPLPPLGKSITVVVTSTLHDKEYTKTFTVFGYQETTERRLIREINEVRLKYLVERMTHPIKSVEKSAVELAQEFLLAQNAYQHTLEVYHESNEQEEESLHLKDSFLKLLELQQQDFYLRSAAHSKDPASVTNALLQNALAAAGLCECLQNWTGMKAYLDTYKQTLYTAVANGVIAKERLAHYFTQSVVIHNQEPFEEDSDRANYIQLLKAWAWTMSEPDIYRQALELKNQLLASLIHRPHSTEDYVSPKEYRELSQLIIERTANRDQAEQYWRKADDLFLDPDSPFYDSKTEESRLHMQRPGWWPT